MYWWAPLNSLIWISCIWCYEIITFDEMCKNEFLGHRALSADIMPEVLTRKQPQSLARSWHSIRVNAFFSFWLIDFEEIRWIYSISVVISAIPALQCARRWLNDSFAGLCMISISYLLIICTRILALLQQDAPVQHLPAIPSSPTLHH